MSEFNLAWEHDNMIPGPVPASAARKIYSVEGASDKMALEAYGTTVPTDGTTGFAPGCTFKKTDGALGTALYINEGTETSCVFNPVATATLADTAAGVGPSPLIWDGAPLLEVMLDPAKGFHHFEDFMLPDVYATTVLNGGLLFTIVAGGSGTVAALTTAQGGVLELDTAGDAADDGAIVQFPGMQVLPQPGQVIYFEARVKMDMDDGDAFIGLSDTASVTNMLGTGTVVTNKDHAAFFRDDGVADANIGAQACDGTDITSEDDVVTDIDKTAYVKYGIVITGDGDTAGDNVKFYVNGVLVKTVTDTDGTGDEGVPDGLIAPTFQINAHTNASDVMTIDWFRFLTYHATNGTARV